MFFDDFSGQTTFSARPDLQIRFCNDGMITYADSMDLLKSTVDKRAKNKIPDTLLLLEHPPTYTLGMRGKIKHLLVPESELKTRNIDVHRADRGGDITFHGPGQLVGYPVLDLKTRKPETRKPDIRQYVKKLENVIIAAIADFNVGGHRVNGFPGVWGNDKKIAAIGIKINAAGISSHGFAINVNTDLAYFNNIIPCGLADAKVTSLAEITGQAIDMVKMKKSVAAAFISEFDK